MVYGGFEGFWRSYGRRQVYTSIWEAIFGLQKWSFSPIRPDFENPVLSDKISNFRFLDSMHENEKWLLVNEGRPEKMEWLMCIPK